MSQFSNCMTLVADIPESLSNIDSKALDASYKQAMYNVLLKIKVSAEKKTPVVTGRLKKGYRIGISGQYPNIYGSVYNNVSYFNTIEFGKTISPRTQIRLKSQPVRLKQLNEGRRMLESSILESQSAIQDLEQQFADEFLRIYNHK